MTTEGTEGTTATCVVRDLHFPLSTLAAPPENSTASLWDLTFSCCERVGTSGRKISGS